jgi:hypothetical protein
LSSSSLREPKADKETLFRKKKEKKKHEEKDTKARKARTEGDY